MKYLGINLTKLLQDLYDKNCSVLIKEITEDLNKWRDISCLCTGRLNKDVSSSQIDIQV